MQWCNGARFSPVIQLLKTMFLLRYYWLYETLTYILFFIEKLWMNHRMENPDMKDEMKLKKLNQKRNITRVSKLPTFLWVGLFWIFSNEFFQLFYNVVWKNISNRLSLEIYFLEYIELNYSRDTDHEVINHLYIIIVQFDYFHLIISFYCTEISFF